MAQKQLRFTRWMLVLAMTAVISACGGSDDSSTDPENCIGASSWTPSVSGMSSSNHNSSTSVTTTTYNQTGALTGLAQDPTSNVVTVNIDMSTDLGDNGSITLAARTTNFPSELVGNAWPVLISLHDGVNELINIAGEENGLLTCNSAGSCSPNSAVALASPSAYADKSDWQQHQIPPFGYATTNVFPTCNWSDGTQPCEFTDTFFSGGKLRTGTYVAKFVLLASNYSSVSGHNANLELRVIRKNDQSAPAASGNGALDLNVVFVGDENISSSQTAMGQTNLNALFSHVYNHYNQSGTGLRLGTITPYEWICPNSGAEYQNIDINDLENLFVQSANFPSTSEGKALNLFITSSIEMSDENANFVILGVSAAIGGTPINGTGGSGLVFSSFGPFDEMNPSCTTSSCPTSSQTEDFKETASTISHEMGHYLGLNHLTESDGGADDQIPDTPECNSILVSGEATVTHSSCISATPSNGCSAACPGYSHESGTYCPTATQCQFNHIMWYTTKNMSSSDGDGNLFSTQSSRIINYSAFSY